jgi:hypothetical protein
MVIASFFMMLLALAAQGLYFWVRDAVTPHLPVQFFVSDIVWAINLCSLFLYKRYPWITITCSWGLLLTVTVFLWRFYAPHTLNSTLLLNSAAITNVFFAHYGVRARKKRNRSASSSF